MGEVAPTLQGALAGEATAEADVDEAVSLELESMAYYLQTLFAFYKKLTPGAAPPEKGEVPPLGSEAHVLLIAAAAEYRLVQFCLHVLTEYLALHQAAVGPSPPKLAGRLLAKLTPSVVALLQGLLQFHDSQFERHLPGFYPLFVDLMHCDSKELREILRDIFSQRIGTVLHKQTPL